MIIDCHGHYTTAPKQHEAWRQAQIEAHSTGDPAPQRPEITDDAADKSKIFEGNAQRVFSRLAH